MGGGRHEERAWLQQQGQGKDREDEGGGFCKGAWSAARFEVTHDQLKKPRRGVSAVGPACASTRCSVGYNRLTKDTNLDRWSQLIDRIRHAEYPNRARNFLVLTSLNTIEGSMTSITQQCQESCADFSRRQKTGIALCTKRSLPQRRRNPT